MVKTPQNKVSCVVVERFPVEASPGKARLVRKGSKAKRRLDFSAFAPAADSSTSKAAPA